MLTPDAAAYRGRFAPSPTGPLHLGSLLAAFGSWLLARHAGGQWHLRIEDLDPQREVPSAAEQQLRTLAAFGMESDGPVLRQSQRGAYYHASLDRLLTSGDAFVCHCSRRDLNANAGIHRQCATKGRRRNPAIRFRVPPFTIVSFDDAIQGRIAQDVSDEVGDFVLKRADGYWAYQLAVVVDDAAQGITDVVRGADLLDSTPRQILLQRALNLPTPRYAHLPLVVDDTGRKLSKLLAALPIDDDAPLPALRAAWRMLGQPAAAIAGVGIVGPKIAWSESVAELLTNARLAFDPGLIPRLPQALHPAAGNVDVTSDH